MDMSGNERRCYCKGKKAQRKATETFYADNMLTTLEEAYASYKIENPEDKLSLWSTTTWSQDYSRNSPFLVSLYLPWKCKTFLIAINRNDSKFPMGFRGFIDKIVCN